MDILTVLFLILVGMVWYKCLILPKNLFLSEKITLIE